MSRLKIGRRASQLSSILIICTCMLSIEGHAYHNQISTDKREGNLNYKEGKMWENIERKYFGEGRINLFKIGEPECSLSSLLILSSLSTSLMISSLMICKTFLNRPSVFFACQILSEMLKDVLPKRGGNDDQKKIVRIICS